MTRRIFILCTSLFLGCTVVKNDSNMNRISIQRFSIDPLENKAVYKLIDTGAIYLNTQINGKDELLDQSGNFIKVISLKKVIKFYGNGRVGMFRDYSPDVLSSLDPRKARMGLYRFDQKGFWIEFVYSSPQAGIMVGKRQLVIQENYFSLTDGEYTYRYEKQNLPKEFLGRTPDW